MADLVRTPERWAACSPEAVVSGSEAQMRFFVADAKADIATLLRRIAALEAEASEGERRGLEPTEDMIEAAAKAIHDHWQNGPGPHARTWEKCCLDLPGAAADFRAKARVGLVAALIPEAPVREGWQPIETAPRDDPLRSILISTRGYVGGVVQVAWSDAHQDFVDLDEETYPDATHWHPLPPPPPQDNREG